MNNESLDGNTPQSSPVDLLLSQRYQLDEEIQKRRREVTILYSDIVGYTRYVREQGDVRGRVLQERHTQQFLPHLNLLDGVLVKTIGDAVMLRFDRPGPAVETACAVLREIQEDNVNRPLAEKLHLRIGIASGKALIEEGDVNGDVVNLSSRLCKMADIDGIMVSEATVRRLDNYLAGLCLPQSDMAIRGIEENAPAVYRVCWDTTVPARHRDTQAETLVLEVTIEDNRLKESLHLQGASHDTVTHYEYLPWKKAIVEEACIQITQAFKRSNAVPGASALATLRAAGGSLYDVLLTSKVKEYLNQSKCEHFIVKIQDSLVSIPWELLHDGQDFLCLKYAMGRQVTSRMKVNQGLTRWSLQPRITIISDPRGDLPAASLEGRELVGRLGASDRLQVAMKSGAGLDYVRKALREVEILHFCGHADYVGPNPGQSGWALSDGKLMGEDIIQMAESHHSLPLMVVANACQSGRSEEWAEHAQQSIYGLASAFLHAGVQHYLGTFWDVLDTHSKEFAVRFYASILEGKNIGMAVRDARHHLRSAVGEENLVWASYMLYGAPAESVFGVPQLPPAETRPAEAAAPGGAIAESRAGQDRQPSPTRHSREVREQPPALSRRAIQGLAVAALLVGVIALGWWLSLEKPLEQGATPAPPPDPSDTVAFLQYLSEKKPDQDLADEWTSRPLTMAVLPLEPEGQLEEGALPLREARETLFEQLNRSKGLRLVEREKLDRALAELDIGTFNVADPEARIRLGRLLAARLLVAGSLTAEGETGMLAVRVFDCESSEIVAYSRSQGDESSGALATQVGGQLLEALRQEYPLRARIVDLTEEGVYLNIGTDVGAEEGQLYRVILEPKVSGVTALPKTIGRIEITGVGPAASLARIVRQDIDFEQGQKVELAPPE